MRFLMGDVMSDLLSQPRFHVVESDGGVSNLDAGNLLEKIAELISCVEQAAVDVAKAAEPAASEEIQMRAWTLIGHEAYCCEDLSRFAVAVSEAVRDESDALYRETRKKDRAYAHA
jgi:hypothetical protein